MAALKAQLEMELQSIKHCSYKGYNCTQICLEGYSYCMRHILEDKNSPYKQCTYVYSNNGKRCHFPAPKDKKDSGGFCTEHALKSHLANSKRNTRCQPPRTAEVQLYSVSHYIGRNRIRTCSSSTQQSDEGRSSTPEENDDGIVTKSLDPFTDIDSNAVLASGSDVLEMCSESESDVDATLYGSVWHDAHMESSDNESVDLEKDDTLKHANIYSAEEVILITRDKLARLQSAYINQYRYLTHMLREHRRRYLYALKREKESYCSIYNQVHDSPKEQRLYKKLKAYNSYHKKHGIEAICHKQLHDRRMKVTEGANSKLTYGKCIFTEGGVKCGERALPVTRHCRKHILEDPNQVLFRACSKMNGDIECTTPVEAIFDDSTCRLHMDIPPLRSYSQIRKDSESDYDDSFDTKNSILTSAPKSNEALSAMATTENSVDSSADLMDIVQFKLKEFREKITGDENQTLSSFGNLGMVLEDCANVGVQSSADSKLKQGLFSYDTDVCIGFPSPCSALEDFHSKRNSEQISSVDDSLFSAVDESFSVSNMEGDETKLGSHDVSTSATVTASEGEMELDN